jgi:hypothetical protein
VVGNYVGFSETAILFGSHIFLIHHLQRTEEQEKANYSRLPQVSRFARCNHNLMRFSPIISFTSCRCIRFWATETKMESNEFTRWLQAALCDATLD